MKVLRSIAVPGLKEIPLAVFTVAAPGATFRGVAGPRAATALTPSSATTVSVVE